MTKQNLREFVNENQSLLVIFGIFIAVLSVSFNFIHSINQNIAGYLAITTCLLLGLLIIEMVPKEGEENKYAIKVNIFLVFLVIIFSMIFWVIYNVYNLQYHRMVGFGYGIGALGLGIFLAGKLAKFSERIDKKILLNFIFFTLSLLVWKYFENFLNIMNNLLSFSGINKEYIVLFSSGFGFILIMWGILEVGINRLLRDTIYKKTLLKYWIKVRNKFP